MKATMMRPKFSACLRLPAKPLANVFPWPPHGKEKAVVVIGATGTGKSRLSIDLATRFGGEVINSDKMQVYEGLNIITNKVGCEERRGVPHHLLGTVDPGEDFTAGDFVRRASWAADAISEKGRLPIIAGGSNSFIKALVLDDKEFSLKYECCFLWVDVSMPILHSSLEKRVDKMVENGLVEEAREFFEPGGNYARGIRRAIGVPEMDEFFRQELLPDSATRAKLLQEAIEKIKGNTNKLASRQVEKILRLVPLLGWRHHHVHRFNATDRFLSSEADEAERVWKKSVLKLSIEIVDRFLREVKSDRRAAIRHDRYINYIY